MTLKPTVTPGRGVAFGHLVVNVPVLAIIALAYVVERILMGPARAIWDNAIYAKVDNAIWSGWIKIGGTGLGTPSCAPLGTGQVGAWSWVLVTS
jgi:hypothetical protein